MADRTIKPDDTNDLVLQNNDGSAKLELNEDQTVKVTTGSDAGEDFTVNTSQLVVEGNTGNVGIGANPHAGRNLTVKGSTEASLRLQSSTRGAFIEITDTTGAGTQYIGTPLAISGSGNKTDIAFWTNSAEKMRIKTGGDVEVVNGNLVIGTAGKGITFGGDPDSRTSSASEDDRTLYDYETGAWTPTIAGTSSGQLSDSSYTHRSGAYTKIGRLVHVTGMVLLNSTAGTIPSGNIMVANLPFNVADVLNNTILESSGSVSYFGNLSTSISYMGIVASTTPGLRLFKVGGTSTTTMGDLQLSDISSTLDLRFFANYYTRQ